jgi:two-component system chemotaxis response regulator CheY
MALDLAIPILVVDRFKGMIRIIHRLLKQLDFPHVDDAVDGNQAIAKLKERKYGHVVCDLELVSGYDLLTHVRSDVVLWNLPFIMVTEGTNSENLLAAKKAGVNTYIVKPFDARTLKGKIETEMTNRRRLVRHRMVKHGQIAYGEGAHTVDCLIRDLSEGGARIQVANAQDLPSELVLSFDDGGAPRPCMVRWRQSKALGIEFIDG